MTVQRRLFSLGPARQPWRRRSRPWPSPRRTGAKRRGGVSRHFRRRPSANCHAELRDGDRGFWRPPPRWWGSSSAPASTTVAVRDQVEVASSTALAALPGQTGQGTAELVRDQGRPELRVQIDAPPSPDRYREVWLINTDGQRMYPLGVLPDDGRATYPLPPALAGQLEGFNIVDVSIEPYDGNPAHSRESQVRGVLPT